MATTIRTIDMPEELDPVVVFGPFDSVIRKLEHAFSDITIHVRGNEVNIRSVSKTGESQAAQAEEMLHTIIQAAYTSPMDEDTVQKMLDQSALANNVRERVPGYGEANRALRQVKMNERRAQRQQNSSYRKANVPGVITYADGVPVRPKTAGQIAYVNAIEKNTITFGIGPAGTGKTYLAVAEAVRAFEQGKVKRIILTRPAVEAGENLGFLPGTLNEKVDPYLRPLYDALSDMLGYEQMRRYMDDGSIEVAPLAYMRGRTLNDAFVILDEAQNTTEQQMKMFLTRLGFNTTMVVTGDITQVDLDVPRSGLKSIQRILGNIEDISFVHFAPTDVVRHALVGKIVAAYEAHDEDRAKKRELHKAGVPQPQTTEIDQTTSVEQGAESETEETGAQA